MTPETSHTVHIFTDDLRIAQAVIRRDSLISKDFFYRQCYPLFKVIYDNYYTDCTDVYEFVNEIYTVILTPNRETGRCQLENYRGESRLTTWLKTVSLCHCYHKYKRKGRMPVVRIETEEDGENDCLADRFLDNSYSTTMNTSAIDRNDLETVIAMMPNERYRNIIRLRYLERRTNEETAEALGMTMANYYNKHKLAKRQYISSLNKESRQ